jgi:hypothetical protein
MNRLLEIGFQFAGHWLLEEERLQIVLRMYGEQRNVLYAFICDGEVKYIGQSTQTLRKRMGGYIRPAPDSSTNIKNNRNIRELLTAGAAVDVYVLPDNGLMHYGPYHLNLAAGLEASLIAALTPQWNGHTLKRQQKAPGKGPAGGEVTEYLPESRLEVSEPTEAEGPGEPLPADTPGDIRVPAGGQLPVKGLFQRPQGGRPVPWRRRRQHRDFRWQRAQAYSWQYQSDGDWEQYPTGIRRPRAAQSILGLPQNDGNGPRGVFANVNRNPSQGPNCRLFATSRRRRQASSPDLR